MNLHLVLQTSKRLLAFIIILVFFYENLKSLFFYYINTQENRIDAVKEKNWFICGMLYNNEAIVDNWIAELTIILKTLDKKKIYVSILENGDSEDITAEKLNQFEQYLHENQIGNTITTHKVLDKSELSRIEYLALYRNKVLEPLFSLGWDPEETRILFLNDIYFKSSSIIRLMQTNNLNYDMACGLDFYGTFYDRWITRDLHGKTFYNYYPYVKDATSQALLRKLQPFRVFSCWNGAVAMKATPFISKGVRFRSHREEEEPFHSECFLIARDFWSKGFNLILINPLVRLTYERKTFYIQKFIFSCFLNFFFDWYHYLTSATYSNPDVANFHTFPVSAKEFTLYF